MNNRKISKQEQTKNTFSYKWKKEDTYQSENFLNDWQNWLFEKYFDGDKSKLDNLLSNGSYEKKILDAGCGAGQSSLLLFGERINNHNFFGVDISDSINVAKENFKKSDIKGNFIQTDLNNIPSYIGNFDIIFSEGVIHHTNSVKDSIINLSKRLTKNGIFMFYVYSKKAPLREFSDDHIRDHISSMNNDEAWEELKSLTKFGKLIGDLNINIDIEDDIRVLDIKKGKYNLQRLFYYKFCKAFYNPEYSLDELNHINFDWFRPQNCHRHTPEELRSFCNEANLIINKLKVEDSGITVIAQKKF